MTINQIICLAVVALCSAGFGVALYFKVKGNLFAAVSELIAVAETTGLPGAMKMNNVVLALHDLVPAPMKSIFTVERLEKIAQYIFDWMRKYADEYKENLELKNTAEQSETVVEADTENRQAAVRLIADLMAMTLAELKEKAEAELGVTLESNSKKRDYIEVIVEAILRSV